MRRTTARRPARAGLFVLALGGSLLAPPVTGDAWVFEPSLSLDQRFDDNYRLEPNLGRNVSATRVIGDVGLSRESQTARFRGAVRVDGLLTQDEFEGEILESNQILFLDSRLTDERTSWGLDLSFKQDTPNRDIAADLDDPESTALDNGVVTQRSDVARRRLVVAPSVERDLTRRASVDATFTYTGVEHDLPSPEDAIYTRYLSLYNAQAARLGDDDPSNDPPPDRRLPTAADGGPLPIGEVDNDTVGVFTPDGELDDYQEARLDLGYRYKLSPISTFSAIASQSYYVADLVPDRAINVPFDQLVREGQLDIYRDPRGRDSVSTTTSFRLGYERKLTPTFTAGVQAGLYYNVTDDSDTFRPEDRENYVPQQGVAPDGQVRFLTAEEYAETLETEEDGWLANVTLSRDTSVSRYSLRFGVDVQPSSIGSQVEAQELVADYRRALGPLLDVSVRARAYEPDRLGANPEDEFARRFISFEPRLVWRFTRAWTTSVAYRYRRQKSRALTEPGESNALLFSLTYTPPSAVRDAAGL